MIEMIRFDACCASGAREQEEESIQTAIDTYIADNSLSALPTGEVPSRATNIFGVPDITLDLATYLRKTTTTFYYCWDNTGKVTAQLESPEECP